MTETRTSAADLISNHPLGRFLDAQSKTTINANLRPVHFEAGATMLQEGERPQALYLIHQGQVEVHKEPVSNQSKPLTVLESPLLLGEISFLLQQPCSATIKTQSTVKGWSLSREALQKMLTNQEPATSGLLFYLGATLAERLRAMNEMVMNLRNSKDKSTELSLGDLEGFVDQWQGEFMLTEEIEPTGWELGTELDI